MGDVELRPCHGVDPTSGELRSSCPRICIGGMQRGRRPVVTAQEIGVARRAGDPGTECPVIRLSLRKPRNWNWKLTTTSSSPSLIAPVIRLVDTNGNVLFDESASQVSDDWLGGNKTNMNRCYTSKSESGGSLSSPIQSYRGVTRELPSESTRIASPIQSYRGVTRELPRESTRITSPIQSYRGVTRELRESSMRIASPIENYGRVTRVLPENSTRNASPIQNYQGVVMELPWESIRIASPIQSYQRRTGCEESECPERWTPELSRAEMVSNVGGDGDTHQSKARRSGSDHLSRHRTPDELCDRDLLRGTSARQTSSCVTARGDRKDGDGNSPAKKKKKHRHRHRKLQDSGYKSFVATSDEAGVVRDARKGKCSRRRGRVFSGATPDSSTSEAEEDEEASEASKRKKRRHRRAAVVGDCLLSVNGHDARFYDQSVALLHDAPDVVHLKLSHRRPSDVAHRRDASSMPSRRTRRRQPRDGPLSGMGANVSRHSEKGLSGRRTQSSGNLCNGNKQLARDVGRILSSCSTNVGHKDRNKFCGSLPNHLDGDYGDDNDVDDLEGCDNNNGTGCAMNGAATPATPATPATATTAQKNQKNGVELRLMPQHDLTALHDQGYGSERSPEDEHLPPLPEPDPFWNLSKHYPFITPDASFEVTLVKGNRGLGLSVTGGADTTEQWPGLIRVKRLFPHQPAWMSGQLSVGDVLLAANGVPLTGLSNYQALEVLRTTPNNVALAVCRPPSDVFAMSGPGEPPPPPRRDPANSITSSRILVPLPLLVTDEPCGEFDIILTKVNRSLGFTLRKEDESVLGHYVRALVREPALSDGRIRPGDKIVTVNDMPMSPLSHEEAVAFLRQCGDSVKLRLYRDAAQTPVAALSPNEDGPSKPRPMLRQEAQDMLTDLAVRKLSPGNSSGSSHGFLGLSEGSSPAASPRRRRLTKTPSPDIQAVAQDRLGQRYLMPSPCGDSDHSREPSRNNTFLLSPADGTDGMFEDADEADGDKPQRPKFLDLCNECELISPSGPRKQKYMFSADGSRSEDSLAMTSGTEDLTKIGGLSECYPNDGGDGASSMEPASLPPLSSASSTSTFSYRNPAYQSAHPACNVPKKPEGDEGAERLSDHDIPGKAFEGDGEGTRGLLKWKGVTFSEDTRSDGENAPAEYDSVPGDEEELTVELNRGWNSRLGFSLQASGSHTYISAVYSDSVAAKDGRLQANDRLITVNDENVEDMSTAEIIDLLRKIRGTIGIRILRKRGPNLQKS